MLLSELILRKQDEGLQGEGLVLGFWAQDVVQGGKRPAAPREWLCTLVHSVMWIVSSLLLMQELES